MQSLLARNLKRRCTAEFKGAHAIATSIDDLIQKLSYATDSVVSCYKGKCGQLCSQRSFACSGKEQGRWDNSDYNGDAKGLNMTEEDEMQFRSIASMRLGPKGVNATKFRNQHPKNRS